MILILDYQRKAKEYQAGALQQPFMPEHRKKEMLAAMNRLDAQVKIALADEAAGRNLKDNLRKARVAYNDAANQQWKNNAWGTVKKYFPISVAARNSFLGLVRLNVFNLAAKAAMGKRLAEAGDRKQSENYAKLLYRWSQLGGDVGSLEKAIEAGKSKNAPLTKKTYSATGGVWFHPDGATEGMLALASAILKALSPIFKALGVGGEEIPASVLKQGEADLRAQGAGEILDEDAAEKRKKTIIVVVIVAGALLVVGLIIYALTKKGKNK